VGPHPYPTMVRDFQSVDRERGAKSRSYKQTVSSRKLLLHASVGEAIRSESSIRFYTMLECRPLRSRGRAAKVCRRAKTRHRWLPDAKGSFMHDDLCSAGRSKDRCRRPGVFQPGLTIPGSGPEHAFLMNAGRAKYVTVSDERGSWTLFRISRNWRGSCLLWSRLTAISYAMKLAKSLGTKEFDHRQSFRQGDRM